MKKETKQYIHDKSFQKLLFSALYCANRFARLNAKYAKTYAFVTYDIIYYTYSDGHIYYTFKDLLL